MSQKKRMRVFPHSICYSVDSVCQHCSSSSSSSSFQQALCPNRRPSFREALQLAVGLGGFVHCNSLLSASRVIRSVPVLLKLLDVKRCEPEYLAHDGDWEAPFTREDQVWCNNQEPSSLPKVPL